MLAKIDAFETRLVELAQLAKALSHPARLAILEVLAERETCICGDLVEELPLAQASVSRHLKALKETGLIKGEIDGPRSCYCLNMEMIDALAETFGGFMSRLQASSDQDHCC